jgi:hypothetical protein
MTPFKSYPITTRQGGHTFSASYELVDGIVRVSSAYGSKSALVGTSAKVTAARQSFSPNPASTRPGSG